MIPAGRRYNRSLGLVQESAVKWDGEVSICSWTGKHVALVKAFLVDRKTRLLHGYLGEGMEHQKAGHPSQVLCPCLAH